jgi:cytochrome c556
MTRILSGIVLLALFAAPAASQDKKDRGKTPELSKKYRELMKSNGKEIKGISEDIEKGKPEADIKKRLAAIRETATKARELKYRKDDEEQEKIDSLFEIFLLKLKNDFQDVEWGDKERRLYLAERLQAKCDVCHEIYRDE